MALSETRKKRYLRSDLTLRKLDTHVKTIRAKLREGGAPVDRPAVRGRRALYGERVRQPIGGDFGFSSLGTQLAFRIPPGTISVQATFSRFGLTRASVSTGVTF